jgi:hypothetical protein
LQIKAHRCIVANKSAYFSKLLEEKAATVRVDSDQELEIDFKGEYMYDAFRKIIDYFYLDDLSVLDSVSDSTEMIEVIKLAKLFQLEALFTAAEHHF